MTPAQPKSMNINVNGESFKVQISYDENDLVPVPTPSSNGSAPQTSQAAIPSGNLKEILAPLEGKVFFTKESGEAAKKVGDQINEGDVVCYIESMKVINAVKSDQSGTIAEVCFSDGEEVLDDDVLFKVS